MTATNAQEYLPSIQIEFWRNKLKHDIAYVNGLVKSGTVSAAAGEADNQESQAILSLCDEVLALRKQLWNLKNHVENSAPETESAS